MRRYAVVNQDNVVINVVLWDGDSPWQPREGCRAIQDDWVDNGDIYEPITQTFNKIITLSEE